MKRILATLLLLIFTLSTFGQTATVTYNVTDFVSTPQTASILTITPLVNGGVLGPQLLTSQARSYAVVTNSSVTISNVAMGYSYQVQFQNSAYRTISMWTNQFPANLTGNINGASWVFCSVIFPNANVASALANGVTNVSAGGGTTAYTSNNLLYVSSGLTNNQVLPGTPSSTNGNFAGTFTGTLTGIATLAPDGNTSASLNQATNAANGQIAMQPIPGTNVTGTVPAASLVAGPMVTNIIWSTFVYSGPAAYSNTIFFFEGPTLTNLVQLAGTYSDPGGFLAYDSTHIRYNGQYYLAYLAQGSPFFGIATSPDDITWSFRGYMSFASIGIATNCATGPKWLVDATNGLDLIGTFATNSAARFTNYVMHVNPANPTNYSGLQAVFLSGDIGQSADSQGCSWFNFPEKTPPYFMYLGSGNLYNATNPFGTWNLYSTINTLNGSSGYIVRQGSGYAWSQGALVFYETSPDLTNWSTFSIVPGYPWIDNSGQFLADGSMIQELRPVVNPSLSLSGFYTTGNFWGSGMNITNVYKTKSIGTNSAVPGSLLHSPDGLTNRWTTDLIFTNKNGAPTLLGTNPAAAINFQGSNWLGSVYSTNFTGNGSGLTNLNAGWIQQNQFLSMPWTISSTAPGVGDAYFFLGANISAGTSNRCGMPFPFTGILTNAWWMFSTNAASIGTGTNLSLYLFTNTPGMSLAAAGNSPVMTIAGGSPVLSVTNSGTWSVAVLAGELGTIVISNNTAAALPAAIQSGSFQLIAPHP
jgi:hypothetical protein